MLPKIPLRYLRHSVGLGQARCRIDRPVAFDRWIPCQSVDNGQRVENTGTRENVGETRGYVFLLCVRDFFQVHVLLRCREVLASHAKCETEHGKYVSLQLFQIIYEI